MHTNTVNSTRIDEKCSGPVFTDLQGACPWSCCLGVERGRTEDRRRLVTWNIGGCPRPWRRTTARMTTTTKCWQASWCHWSLLHSNNVQQTYCSKQLRQSNDNANTYCVFALSAYQ